ncbi:hypothetical protein B484DRAFT_244299 [Ochromonadaceae sp. CCMP2298]|nr:hypothetical protein B484DRAFT_244299 [Ochromonadaceae sp. CCMP2298]
MTLLVAALAKYLPHRWRCKWDLHQRRLLLDTFENDKIVILTDFSANYNCDPTVRLNSATSEHAILDVVLVIHSPEWIRLENGQSKRVVQNDAWYFWGTKQSGRLGTDNFYHAACMEEVLAYYKQILPFTSVALLTDRCPAQYKCRKNCMHLAAVASHFDITIDHHFSPTANFKPLWTEQARLPRSS